MGTWQIVVIVLWAISLLASARVHGTPRTGKNSFWVTLVNISFTFYILFKGGFFN